ncbi:hypothetical protein AB0M46_50825 [Dactylosporangium sp. NPDC051485]|uniref:hypothetical protein n=1 Tax=Dactylosporangium sp. NPDC051485 TaxID=3154846 RepID=UPI0034465EE0
MSDERGGPPDRPTTIYPAVESTDGAVAATADATGRDMRIPRPRLAATGDPERARRRHRLGCQRRRLRFVKELDRLLGVGMYAPTVEDDGRCSA